MKNQKKGPLPAQPSGWQKEAILSLLLVLITFLIYFPAWHGGFLWDDNLHISENRVLRTADGLWKIWASRESTVQYYPLTFTLFWVGYHLWGLDTLGYHWMTLFFHGLTSVLLWRVLTRLKVRGAFLAAAIFALHPVNVMSVAWMTELKNTLSGCLALASGWSFLRAAGIGIYSRSDQPDGRMRRRDWLFYALSLGLFLFALLAKTGVSFLPLTLLLVVWWQRNGKVSVREGLLLLPFLGIAVGLGEVTSHLERHAVGAGGQDFNLGFLDRVLVSGRSFWFYLGRLFYPHDLTFIYERWTVDPKVGWQYLFPLATVGVMVGLWAARKRIGRGPLVAVLHFYIGTSLLILLLVLYMTRYSFVSDHWQYFGCMGIFALFASAWFRVFEFIPGYKRILLPLSSAIILVVLSALTWRQCSMYSDVETLWRTTIERNPKAWMAWSNLGYVCLNTGRVDEALDCYHKSLELHPDDPQIYYVLGGYYLRTGQLDQAISFYEKNLAIDPSDEDAHVNLATAYFNKGRTDDAIAQLQKALQLHPADAMAQVNLANMLLQKGQVNEAIAHFRAAAQADPRLPNVHNQLASLLLQSGHMDEAITQFRAALEIEPGDAMSRITLGDLLLRKRLWNDAMAQYQAAVQLQSTNATILSHVAWVLATCPETSVRNGDIAMKLALRAEQLSGGSDPVIPGIVAAACAEAGQFTEAIAAAQRALAIATAQNNAAQISALKKQIELFQAHLPFRDASLTNAVP
jgi:tetratricopeptide (TPR) repeat protein